MPCSADYYRVDNPKRLLETRAIAQGPPDIVTHLWQIALQSKRADKGFWVHYSGGLFTLRRVVPRAPGPTLIQRIRDAQALNDWGRRVAAEEGRTLTRTVWEARVYE
ncbi:hypothetical protein Dda_8706 [Drechslerella dactyloides]|uniref:Uncharacterized protein n=1 Tax=Drechslerella dactyloides TaxID=74499 RepID=A0AAD6NG32_DREDA|nr:hypothetical protein Dda_8706 [Drechslerella dactyloides]